MPPSHQRAPCQVCKKNEMKYTCSVCAALYCSVPCYKQHKESSCTARTQEPSNAGYDSHETFTPPPSQEESTLETILEEPKPLKPLTSLRWPYVPDESSYPDPLERDDPKPLQLRHYESIATSAEVRKSLESHPNLQSILKSIDSLKGYERESTLQRALGVQAPSIGNDTKVNLDEDVLALRAFAEAIETAIRGERVGALGLDWGD
ncbi:hypothetical protein E1B28_011317 [Marasmius oreades]|uniref:HIT-type domain-containing protein n=1 Tax=Marasmius oreades TaxID=181124 RepID=A0A9P7UR27_9AGAR|nr:uncharacterized protein E1B28_011317 [Marasmius oreades]KAG7089656.1 hypothetical protein E1B28_011317 [Marasmius oreades]